jgi:hypothetical protein
MAASGSIRVVKHFDYRGSTRAFSNRYHFNGPKPSGDAAWLELADLVVLHEKPIFDSAVTIVGVSGYGTDEDVAEYMKSYSVAGTGSFPSTVGVPGDCAAVGRWSTGARSVLNHPIYLFSYWHGVRYDQASSPNNLCTAQKNAMSTYATWWKDGIAVTGGTLTRASKAGHQADGVRIDPFIRHRDFPGG